MNRLFPAAPPLLPLLLLPALLVAGTPGLLAQNVTPAEAQKLTDNLVRILSNGELELIDETFDPMVRMRSPVVPQEVVGIGNFRMFAQANRMAFPDLAIDISSLILDGDTVVARFTLKGTHQGPLLGMAPTGRSFQVPGVAVARIENGKILEWQDYWNAMELYGALGFRVLPPADAKPAAAPAPDSKEPPPGR